ncbi:hypothetical protein A3D14_01085 [Candidatus Saccharibacteria bacterium RIFCSPHIGHO2_02_FULL_47_12]|nr:MAG: hypothetical protein A3D14_01085 [Candidatus Saccharibacteria bacterium RIFCSPHIGHO2_02_FULL_47_12]
MELKDITGNDRVVLEGTSREAVLIRKGLRLLLEATQDDMDVAYRFDSVHDAQLDEQVKEVTQLLADITTER